MVKSKKSNFRKNRNPKEFRQNGAKAKKINASMEATPSLERLAAQLGPVAPRAARRHRLSCGARAICVPTSGMLT